MIPLVIFAAALMLAVLVSELAYRSVLSTAVLFLVVGFATGSGGLQLIRLQPGDPAARGLADLALFSILFSDGMRVGLGDLRRAWRLPGRALLIGLPLTLIGTAVAARYIAGLSWAEALLVGAVLSPTDPVFAAAIVGREEIPARLRHLLNVESGLNDGLALPFVVGLLALLTTGSVHALPLGGEVASGIGLGVLVPVIAVRLARRRFFAVHESHRTLFAFAVGMLIFSVAPLTHANSYLAAFAAGITLVTMLPKIREVFYPFSEPLTELLKLAALLVFGALISGEVIHDLHAADYVFGFVALVLIRPIAIALAVIGSDLTWRETLVAGWFGPKGFASVVYGLMVLQQNPPRAHYLAHLIAIVVIGSIVAHSSTDVVIAHWFRRGPRDTSSPGG
ncbi:MAG: cation:proton antiporter [Chthoniobacterales bacterium]